MGKVRYHDGTLDHGSGAYEVQKIRSVLVRIYKARTVCSLIQKRTETTFFVAYRKKKIQSIYTLCY